MRVLLELTAVLAAILIAVFAPTVRSLHWPRLRLVFRALANRPKVAIASIGALVLLVEVSIGLLVQQPLPGNTDEFSYVLAGDTFAHGRLTNPTHPLWEHFESYNIIQRPTYQSKYPPGQGLALALGQVVFGEAFAGVWISLAAACAAVAWMLYGWLPRRWALLGALLSVANVTLLRHWGQSYWGGAVALLGGALVFGAWPRLVRSWRTGDGLCFGLGLAILAISRPYEGLVAALPATGGLLWRMVQAGWPRRWALWRQVVLPAVTVLLLALAWLGYYQYRVTGDPLRMPYLTWQATYTTDASLLDVLCFWRERTIPDRTPERTIGQAPTEDMWRQWFEATGNIGRKLYWQWSFFVSLTLTPALLVLVTTLRHRGTRVACLTVGLVLLAIVLQKTRSYPHYLAPAACLVSLLLVQGFRRMYCWRPGGQPRGRFLMRALLAIHVGSLFCLQVPQWLRDPFLDYNRWSVARTGIEATLARSGEKHVVLVRYPETGARTWDEWVYNRADIDAATVIWARDLGLEKNRRLIEYYSDRRLWTLDVGQAQLRPLPKPEVSPARSEP